MASDQVLREGVRQSLVALLERLECGGSREKQWEYKQRFINKLRHSPIATETERANEQHYEVPTKFFTTVLGPRLKYSSCNWTEGVNTLQQAEDASLKLICERARVEDGQKIMDLGCGWGSLSLYICEKFPRCHVTSVSNSNTQRAHIEGEAMRRGYADRLHVITADANHFVTAERYDRIISIEMFEHMKNYELLLARVSSWLKPAGMLFTQILCHWEFPYSLERKAGPDSEWMADNFFSGGTMPSADLFTYFQKDVTLVDHWRQNGTHYQRTLEAWLEQMDAQDSTVREIMETAYGKEGAQKQIFNWRLFFMFCAEVFGHSNGNEWIVSFHLFKKKHASNL